MRPVRARHTRAYIGLGSNLAGDGGDPAANLARAAHGLEALDGVAPAGRSSVWRTEPQGFRDQPWFANQVLALDCAPDLSPEALMARLLALEAALGRVRPGRPATPAGEGGRLELSPETRFAPRCIDLDLLLFGDREHRSPALTLPHPRMHERAFVLVPLLELDPAAVIPGIGPAAKALGRLRYRVDGERIHQK